MPPRKRTLFREPEVPQLLSPFWLWFFRGLIVIGVCSFVTASFGTWVLSDHDRKSWISNTAFADYWRAFIEWNQVMNGLTFNGGMFGVVIGFTRLYQHRQAAQLQAPPPVDSRSRQQKRQDERAFRKDL